MDSKFCFTGSLTFQIEATARIFYSFAKEEYREFTKNKITLEEYVILDTLVHYPHLNKNSIAKTLLRDISYIDRMIEKLIKKRYLKEIKNNGTDIQVKYFELTKAGEKIYQDCTPQNDKILAILLKFVSENELLNFTKTLLKIRNVIISLDSF